ncbi:MAG: hypothetical protein UV64_C0013G0002 [Parcubacteria group bacterium GW2011_GWC1_43_11b]|uniref:Ig-like domain-containing protein n=2 Tax=Candidatus Vogeliibacteriota TaxID=1817922 RepID=A0A1G2QFF1_9BACT|nr:MAG: hypothetical protein UV50_C0013G0001 [Parcubacteria group bacterium GW2011_GWB1_42_9]KKS89045.1 MAG: hypothetical protein UV64_C0013G0002 [Parcubacteria group bacterium GW2011_GWC1_43_11b]KKT09477.1 MAG: hypothetical protein UV88_C0009G0001 [Parcubacteria group bacterium GW2011_GWA1_43_21]OHA59217.1 MAG: hypothetical protein A2370_00300 [Candidatus Vogelbacteria bacterium RIFOXYB1_FULL_42_16]OHA59957.1 MAG: hypothetical protein A2607_00635 [Candidatus Vogelbacteria bacterium RIFOXYD1_FU
MEKIVKIVFVGGLFLVALFPFSSFAVTIEPSCKPDNTKQDQICSFCPRDGAEYVHLKWDVSSGSELSNSYRPNCVLKCENKVDSKGCRYGNSIDRIDSYGNPSKSQKARLLKPVDDIFLPKTGFLINEKKPVSGDVYTLSCVGRLNTNSGVKFITKESPKMSIIGCVESVNKVYEIGLLLGKVVRFGVRACTNPAGCAVDAVETVCQYKLTSVDHGVVTNIIGSAIKMAIENALPAPQGVARTIRLFTGDLANSDNPLFGNDVYKICRLFGSDTGAINFSIPYTDYYTCDPDDPEATSDGEDYWANCRGYGN